MTMMQLEARILGPEGEELDGYFYATQDVEYVMAESIARARIEVDGFASLEVVPFNGEYQVLATYDLATDEVSYYC